jgi:ketol-acid reductoisomerase
MQLPKIYKDKDADLNLIKNKSIGIIGYGNQGRAQALNLLDSGMNVSIGLRNESSSWKMAVDSGLHCTPVNEIVKDCDIISLLIPDQVMKKVYSENIEPHLTEGKTLLFSHGYNIHYNLIQPPKFINVVMAAPSGAGSELRKQFKIGKGIPGLIAVHQDYSGDSFDIALSYSKAIGLTRMGVFESTFKEETETDLFGEQIILTGGIPKLIQSAYKVLLEANYNPITAWFVCYYELKTIVDLFHSKGFEFMNQAISDTAEFGGITRGNRIINENVRNEMRLALEEIQSGKFHKEWMDEYERGYPQLKNMREQEKQIPIEEISKQLLKALCENK